ncbi:MAG TPA: POTRA domain-containing protein [Bacteroidales bacterium]|nr:POTRA domain-containing protein [Bacteroidales bacterium]HSA42867.1 POTRA domain-containing protein [Bacteroidales bacterium]
MRIALLAACLALLLLSGHLLQAQNLLEEELELDYTNPRTYEIGGITVSGIQYLDHDILISITGLAVGDAIRIPGDNITKAIKKLWDQGLFENIAISATRVVAGKIFLNIHLTERPRLSKFTFNGIRKGEADNLREDIKLTSGDVITDNILIRSKNTIQKYFVKKGFLNTEVEIIQKRDSTRANNVILFINIQKHSRVRINKIYTYGNEQLSSHKIRKVFKETKEKWVFQPFDIADSLLVFLPKYVIKGKLMEFRDHMQPIIQDKFKLRIFKASRYIAEDFNGDKLKLIEKYNELGYRDFVILRDSISTFSRKSVDLHLWVEEGRKFYFRNISWVGNTKYTSETLNGILKIKKGMVYNMKLLETNLSFNPEGFDVSSLYLDDGYLFFNVEPVEIRVENDSIDIEIRIREGKQARINKVTIKGNNRTNDHVIMREIRTRPGQLFSRSDIIRTTRELAQLRYFNAEKINPVPKPNPADGTVDIEYEVEETSSDQIEMSGGWGYGRIVGNLGLSFNNFSLRNIFNWKTYSPIPSGDGQKLSLRFQSYGKGYSSYNISFTEPWLGGKKPNALSLAYFHSLYSNGYPKSDTNRQSFVINGVVISLGKRLTWPDDYFSLYHSITLQRYDLDNYAQIFTYSDGYSNNFSYGISLSRNSVDAPIFPRQGSEISLNLEVTPPYSLFSEKNYKNLSDQEKYRFIEYHKWNFLGAWHTRLFSNFVLFSRVKYGFLGAWNSDIGVTPFERFYLGGDGLSGYNSLDGRDIIGMRGYSNESLTPEYSTNSNKGGTIYSKYSLELRYPISLNPNATIYGMAFLEGGNAWLNFKEFNPFSLKRAAGVGVRVFLPMFGILGLDWGYGFDKIPGLPGANGGQFHFSINQSID